MLVTLFEIVTLVNLLQPSKARSPMLVTLLGMITTPPSPLYSTNTPSSILKSLRSISATGVFSLEKSLDASCAVSLFSASFRPPVPGFHFPGSRTDPLFREPARLTPGAFLPFRPQWQFPGLPAEIYLLLAIDAPAASLYLCPKNFPTANRHEKPLDDTRSRAPCPFRHPPDPAQVAGTGICSEKTFSHAESPHEIIFSDAFIP